MEEHTPYYVMNRPVHTIGPKGPLHSSTTSLPILSSVSYIIFVCLNFHILFTLLQCFTTYVLHVSLFLSFFFFHHMLGQLWTEIRLRVAQGLPLCWHTCVLAVWLPFTQCFTTGCCASRFFLCLIQCACKCVSLAAALWDWATGTRPLLRWLGNPV